MLNCNHSGHDCSYCSPCYCDCHQNPHVRHCMPCCGTCGECGRTQVVQVGSSKLDKIYEELRAKQVQPKPPYPVPTAEKLAQIRAAAKRDDARYKTDAQFFCQDLLAYIDHLERTAGEVANPAIEAIKFAIEHDGAREFLRAWLHGEADVIRKEWPETPAAVLEPLLPKA